MNKPLLEKRPGRGVRPPILLGHSARIVAGFTLMELLIVLVLIGILMSITFPSISRGVSVLKLKTTSREIAAIMRLGKWKAIREQQIYWMRIDSEKNEIELGNQSLQYQKMVPMPDGVSIVKVSLLKEREAPQKPKSAIYYFLPNGLCDRFQVVIKSERGQLMKVFQDALTGSPRIEQVPAENES